MVEVLAIIPARSGSKSVKDKNIRLIDNKPMLAYSIKHAQNSKYINRIILSTDSEKYAQIGLEYGAEVPFLRPAEYSTDDALDIDVFYHALSYLKEKENYIPDYIVQLRPTYPIRDSKDIDKMLKILMNNKSADSIRSVSKASEIPYKMWTMDDNNTLSPVCTFIKECYNMPRQKLPVAYYQNACIDIVRSETILNKKSMTGDIILGYFMEDNFDIDTLREFELAEEYLIIRDGKKNFCFDIDGVIAITNNINDYSKSEPNFENIEFINKLYDFGNHIQLFTARGYVTGIDWYEITKNQMQKWGVKYHELKIGKPNADYYVDDRAIDLFNLQKLKKLFKNKEEEKC